MRNIKASYFHHVSIVTSDLSRSVEFYQDVFGLERVARPSFLVGGAWMRAGAVEIHLVDNAEGTFRRHPVIDSGDSHFALWVDDFEEAVRHLTSKGFSEAAAQDDPKRLLVIRDGIAGFPQAYLLDPDRHVIELNAAASSRAA